MKRALLLATALATFPVVTGQAAISDADAVRAIIGEAGNQSDTAMLAVASALRIGNPVRWEDAMAAATESRGAIRSVTDAEILDAFRLLASREGMFCEPASAASVAGLLKYGAEDAESIVCVLTGRGLKDPETAIANNDGMVIQCAAELAAIEEAVLGDP